MPAEPCRPIEIRPFCAADGEKVRGLIVGIQRGEFGMGITSDDQPDLADVATFYRRGAGNFWVADQGGAIRGTLGLLDIGGGEGALRKMFVDLAFRGRDLALADRLLDALIDGAKRQGMRSIFLGTTAWFHAAHNFYRRRGFEEIDAESLPASFPIMSVDTRFFALDLEKAGGEGG